MPYPIITIQAAQTSSNAPPSPPNRIVNWGFCSLETCLSRGTGFPAKTALSFSFCTIFLILSLPRYVLTGRCECSWERGCGCGPAIWLRLDLEEPGSLNMRIGVEVVAVLQLISAWNGGMARVGRVGSRAGA